MRSLFISAGIISFWVISSVSINVGDTTLSPPDSTVNRPVSVTPQLVVERCAFIDHQIINTNDDDSSNCVGARLRTTDAIKSQSIGVDVFKRALWYNFLSHLIDIVLPREPHTNNEEYNSESAALYKRSLSDDHQLPDASSHTSTSPLADVDGLHKVLDGSDAETWSQPLHSFVLSSTMIIVSEVGDKTFLIAALMAMKHERVTVFSAAFGALAVMTVLSAVLGHALPNLISQHLSHLCASILFFFFGFRLLKEGMAMSSEEGVSSEMQEVELEIAEKEHGSAWHRPSASPSDDALEMGLEHDLHHQQLPLSNLQQPDTSALYTLANNNTGHGLENLISLVLSPAWVQTFVMTFLGEWGDRSQIATIAMAAGQDYWWVILGALMGHALCTGVAVIGGRAIAGQVSLKIGTLRSVIQFENHIDLT
jgi:putative Ca2+/H+ antiporter (TMEM165/GDT1 family)